MFVSENAFFRFVEKHIKITENYVEENGLWFKRITDSKALAGYPDGVYSIEFVTPENKIMTRIFNLVNENVKRELENGKNNG